MATEFVVRSMRLGDVENVASLQALAFPPPFPADHLWQPDHLREHLSTFPEGQFVTEIDQVVVGSASSIIVDETAWRGAENWDQLVGGMNLVSHDAGGTTLFGVDVTVHPDFRRRGIARALYDARFDLVRRRNLVRFATACRLPGYGASGASTPAVYARLVADGGRIDPTMTPLLRMGLRFDGVLAGFMVDEESGHAAAKLEWTP